MYIIAKKILSGTVRRKELCVKFNSYFKNKKTRNPMMFSPMLGFALFAVMFVVGTLLLSCTVASNLDPDMDIKSVGESIRQALSEEQGEVVATINDVSYYERDLKVVMANLQIYKRYNKMTEEQQRLQAGDELVLQSLMLQEFDRLGLTLTEEQYTAYVEENRRNLQQEIADQTESAQRFVWYLEGLGLTFSQYWEDEYTMESLRSDMKIQLLQQHICIDIKNLSKVNDNAVHEYLTELIKDGTYQITLFGKEYK